MASISIVVFHVCQYVIQAGGPANRFLTEIARFEIVELLFVLSAYLLALPYARAALDGTSALPAREFLFRRAVRILPLYWVGVTTIWSIRNPVLPGDWRDLLEHLTFTQVFDRQRIFYTLGPTWSMSLEIMFYGSLMVLGPASVRLCARLRSRRVRVATLLLGCATLWLIPLLWNLTAFLVARVPYDDWPVYFGPQARFGAFGAGMALAVVAGARRGKPLMTRWWPSVVRILAIAIIAAATSKNEAGTLGQAIYHDIAAIGWTLLVGSTVLGADGQLWARAMSCRPLMFLGMISYSTYIWHEPIMQNLQRWGITDRSQAGLPWNLAVVLLASVLAGWLSYLVIERPTGKLRALHTKNGGRRDYYPELG